MQLLGRQKLYGSLVVYEACQKRGNKKMRVLMINRADASIFPGGAKIQVEKTANELRKIGVEGIIKAWDTLEEKDFKCDIVHIFGIQNAKESWLVAQRIRKLNLPWVLSPIYWPPYEHWFNLYGKEKKGWRIIYKNAGYKATFAVYRMWLSLKSLRSSVWQMQRDLVKYSGALLPNSNIEAHEIIHNFNLGKKYLGRMFVIPNGIDPDIFSKDLPALNEWKEKLGSSFVLQVGRVSKEKNNIGLIQALYNLPLKIVFVGPQNNPYDYLYSQECIDLANRRGNVVFTGEIPHSELASIYALAGVHVLPSYRETPGLVSLEAAMCGCAVVSTSIGSAKEYFEDNAWYCHPAYPETIRDAVKKALSSPHDDSLRKRILEKFTWQQAARETLKAYEFALANT
jgi:glycosyltransferase involved in cell wall biosynthesis